MATPHVSAAIADIISVLNNASKTYTTASITQILQSTALYPDSSSGKSCNTAYNGGCVASGAMNVESAIYYALNVNLLSASTNSLIFGGSNSTMQNVTFTNNNNEAITLESMVITDTDGNTQSALPSIVTTTCSSGQIINTGESCTMNITWQSTDNTLTALLKLTSTPNSDVVATITISNNGVLITPTTNPTSGGGCSMIQDGNDDSILLLIILIMTIGTIRYIQRKTK